MPSLIPENTNSPDAIDWWRVSPFVALHIGCFAVFWVGISPIAVTMAILFYLIRMFAITAFYHRYFSHRTFRMGRVMQFVAAVLGNSSGQRSPLWWAAHHRQHHRCADKDGDAHSPRDGFWWSHMVWFLSRRHFDTAAERIPDLMQYPELRWLDRHDWVVPSLFLAATYFLGVVINTSWPSLGTSGAQMFVWAGLISTVVLTHATLTINSLAHRFGTRRYQTSDQSRNNFWLALITLGEGWHNNHHHYPGSARQGFFWWEIDISYYGLKFLAAVGLVSDLKPVPSRMLSARRVRA